MSADKQVINIISNCAASHHITGPYKVLNNTCKGFDLIGQPYVINRNISDYSWNWIHDSIDALIEVAMRSIPAVIGPNLVVLPDELPRYRPRLKNCIYLQPSEWVVSLWRQLGFSECPLQTWPVGIDCRSFDVKEKIYNNQVLIYYKERAPELLIEVQEIVSKHNLSAHIICYGEYNEEQFLEVLAKCSFGVWLGRHESQGIALQEALAADVPMIVIDAKSLFDSYGRDLYRFPTVLSSFRTTSAPYFDTRCGIIIDDISELENAISRMKKEFINYNPKQFITNQLSLEISAIKLVETFTKLKVNNNAKSNIRGVREYKAGYFAELILRMNRAHNLVSKLRQK